MWPHEVEPWFHSWYREEILDARKKVALFELCPHEVEPWFHSWYREEILDARKKVALFELCPHEVEPCFHSWYRVRVVTLYILYMYVCVYQSKECEYSLNIFKTFLEGRHIVCFT